MDKLKTNISTITTLLFAIASLAGLFGPGWLVIIGQEEIAMAAPSSGTEVCEILLKFNHFQVGDQISWLEVHRLKPLQHLSQIDVWVVDCGLVKNAAPAEVMAQEFAEQLERDASIRWAEPNDLMHAAEVVPDDTFYAAQQSNLAQIGLPLAWTLTTGDQRPIAVIDTAFDLDHPDLADKYWTNSAEIPANSIDDDGNGYVDDTIGWDFYSNDADPGLVPGGDSSHGTHVAGIAAASSNNHLGIAGVSWNSTIMTLRALGRDASGPYSAIAEAIIYAADNGAPIVNMSLGGISPSEVISEAVGYAAQHGVLMVASAGNGGGDVLYPAALPEVIAVSAVDGSDLPWEYSNRGPEVELAAPGVDIFSTDSTGFYVTQSGTSQAAPHVSGVAALVWSLQTDWSAQEVRTLLNATVKDVWIGGRDNLTGYGRVDALKAVGAANPHSLRYFPYISYDPGEGE